MRQFQVTVDKCYNIKDWDAKKKNLQTQTSEKFRWQALAIVNVIYIFNVIYRHVWFLVATQAFQKPVLQIKSNDWTTWVGVSNRGLIIIIINWLCLLLPFMAMQAYDIWFGKHSP